MNETGQKVPRQSSAELISSRPSGASDIPLLPASRPGPKAPSGSTRIAMKHLAAQRKKKTCSSSSYGLRTRSKSKTHSDSAALVLSVPRATVGKRRPQRRRNLPREREEDGDCEMEICEDATTEVQILQGDDAAVGFGAGEEYVLGAAAPAHEAPSATPSNTKSPDAICFLCLAPVYLADSGGQADAAGPRAGGGGPEGWLSSYFEEPIAVPQQQPGVFSSHSPMMGLVPSHTAWEAGGTAPSQVRGPAPATPSWTVTGQGSAASAQSIAWALDAGDPPPGGDAYYAATSASVAAHHGLVPPTRPGAPAAHVAPFQWAPGSGPLLGTMTSGPPLRSQGSMFDPAAGGVGGEPLGGLGGLPSTFSGERRAAPWGED